MMEKTLILKHISRMLCLLISYSKFTRTSQGNSLNVKKKYGMIKGRTDKDTRITEVFRYNGTVQAGIY